MGNRSAEFRKAKSNRWTSLPGGTATLPATGPVKGDEDPDAAAADAIVANAAASTAVAGAGSDDQAPAIVKMESGAHAGLQTAAQLAAQLKRTRRDEARALATGGGDGSGGGGAGAETIYRDASGRVVNVAMQRAEARRKAAAEAKAQADAEEAARGDVQRREKEKRTQDLKDAALLPVARYADDEDLNEEQRAVARWNDPAADFLSSSGKGGRSVTGRPLYKGAAPPNRYGIRPGHQWDGVDRGNDFEAKWFKARNRDKNRRDLEYQWQMDE